MSKLGFITIHDIFKKITLDSIVNISVSLFYETDNSIAVWIHSETISDSDKVSIQNQFHRHLVPWPIELNGILFRWYWTLTSMINQSSIDNQDHIYSFEIFFNSQTNEIIKEYQMNKIQGDRSEMVTNVVIPFDRCIFVSDDIYVCDFKYPPCEVVSSYSEKIEYTMFKINDIFHIENGIKRHVGIERLQQLNISMLATMTIHRSNKKKLWASKIYITGVDLSSLYSD